MLRGIFTSASGMLLEGIRMDVTANNLANADTHGFKRQTSSVRAFPEMLIHRINDAVGIGSMRRDPRPPIGVLGTGAAIDELALQHTPGPIEWTGRPLDVAVDGPGFLSVLTPEGEVAYTRDGRLRVDVDGMLMTEGGMTVLGAAGPVFVGAGEPTIDDQGTIWVDGEQVGTLALWEFPEPRALERLGENLLVPTGGSGAAVPAVDSGIRSEHIENANVNVVREMVSMISIQRAYEANQKLLQVQDETLGRLINDVASLA